MNYYPKLKDIIPSGEWNIEFINEALDSLIDNIYYKNFVSSSSEDGASKFHSVSLVFYGNTSFSFPGLPDLELVLCYDSTNQDINTLHTEVVFEWEAKKHIKQLKNVASLNLDPEFILSLISQTFYVSSKEILMEFIDSHFETSSDPYQNIIDDINAEYSPTPSITKSSSTDPYVLIEELVDQLGLNNINTLDPIIDIYCTNSTWKEILKNGLKNVLKNFDLDNILDYLVPKLEVRIKDLSAAILFPNEWLRPVDINNVVIPNKKSSLEVLIGDFSLSSYSGFYFNNQSAFNFHRSVSRQSNVE